MEGGCSTAGLHMRSGLPSACKSGSHTCEERSVGRACTRKVAPKHRPCSCQVGSGCLFSKRRRSHACSRRRVSRLCSRRWQTCPPGCPATPVPVCTCVERLQQTEGELPPLWALADRHCRALGYHGV